MLDREIAMGKFLSGFILPALLVTAALLNRSLMSLADMLAFLIAQYNAPKMGLLSWRRSMMSWYILLISSVAVLLNAVFHFIWAIKGDEQRITEAEWLEKICFIGIMSWRSPNFEWCMLVHVLRIVFAAIEIRWSSYILHILDDSLKQQLYSSIKCIGSHLRVVCYLFIPFVQLAVGISHPSWTLFPFFVGSSVGLINWSLTSNFLGLYQWSQYLLLYAGFNISLLYVYQLPLKLTKASALNSIATFIGLYKLSPQSEWSTFFSSVALLSFYIMLSWIRCELTEMDYIMTSRESRLNKPLLPPKHSLFIRELRSGVRHTNVLLRRTIFRTFSVNFFTYGFPISLLALSFWSFHFASVCAFALLGYVGYILYVFPSLFHLHHLNGLLLVFILLWAASTYIFNVAFTVLNKEVFKDMQLWETIGLWHYPIPGFYILAQFGLGVLVSLVNLVNNSVFQYLSDGDGHLSNDNDLTEVLPEEDEAKVLVVATIAWGLRKVSRVIGLVLLSLVALKPGFIHAVYMVFFLMYLLNSIISRKMHQSLVLLCEIHFGLLYVLRLKMVSNMLEHKASFAKEILFQLGFIENASTGDLLKIASVACFCALQNHGLDILSSFSVILQHTPCAPVGFGILKAGLIKSVLLSVYTSRSKERNGYSFHERKVVSYLSTIRKRILNLYRTFGTYVASLTVLFAVYLVRVNLLSFGYIFFVLLWMMGRQLLGKTRQRLWLPLKIYAVFAFTVIYVSSIFSIVQTWLSGKIDMSSAVGYDPESSIFENVWESLAVLVVMQLYSYERTESKNFPAAEHDISDFSSFSFLQRLLMIHCDKIMYAAVLYASLSPVSVTGFLYACTLVASSTLPKSSWITSRVFLMYSGFILMCEYLFQLWGQSLEMFPGQRHCSLSLFLGLRQFSSGFFGLEAGLRRQVLVISSCLLQYNVFFWLKTIKHSGITQNEREELCFLFDWREVLDSTEAEQHVNTEDIDFNCQSWSSVSFVALRGNDKISSETEDVRGHGKRSHVFGTLKEIQKSNRKRMHVLRKERLQMQIIAAKLQLKFWVENMFNLFGLEMNMAALLLASFALLNFVSLFYITALAACIMLPRQLLRRWWHIFVFLFGLTFILQYLASMLDFGAGDIVVPCSICWKSSDQYYDYCRKCWFGIILDDTRILASYYVVYALASFKLRSDHFSSRSLSERYQKLFSCYKKASLDNLTSKTKFFWTFLDYLRLYIFCHLLDLVLSLILITGTLEFDILHLGYLGFAMLFFRLRFQILKKKNKIFKFLRMYNFTVIVLSLAYQSPFVGSPCEDDCKMINYFSEIIGFYKYDYGFRITSRSALVEIVIYMLVSLQSHMFSTEEFDYVSEYLEAEQIDAFVREQEKKAAWKTAQLQEIRRTEEEKRIRNLQVEKMKSEMLNLQTQLHNMNIGTSYGNAEECEDSPNNRANSLAAVGFRDDISEGQVLKRQYFLHGSSEFIVPFDRFDSSASDGSRSPLLTSRRNSPELSNDVGFNRRSNSNKNDVIAQTESETKRSQGRKHPIVFALNLFSDGVSETRSLCKLGVTNLVKFFNIKREFSDSAYDSSDDEEYYEVDNTNSVLEPQPLPSADWTLSVVSDVEPTTSDNSYHQIGMILRYLWAQMRSNNDIVCYCCFVLVFLWNFSLYSMVYPAILFLYALCVNTGPKNSFWVLMMVYSEMCIIVQYIYQIVIQHCEMTFSVSVLQKIGFPAREITASFVISNWPLFLVYLFILLQTSITARDGQWLSGEWRLRSTTNKPDKDSEKSYMRKIHELIFSARYLVTVIVNSLGRYWNSLTRGAETPPYFVQLSMKVEYWPEDGIQPDRIRSLINKMLKLMHDRRCQEKRIRHSDAYSMIRVQSIERSQDNDCVALVVFEVLNVSPLRGSEYVESYKSLTPAADVANEILEGERTGVLKHVGFPYSILSVIGGGKREIDLYAYIFCADLAVFFLVSIFYQLVMKNKSEFLEVYQEDQFPKEFVFILMVIFFLIVVDRIIYLCSFATGKVFFYLFNLCLFTYMVTWYSWYLDAQRRHAGKFALRAIYLTKSVSLALQAVQIRFGVPHESTLYRQCLTSSISYLNYIGYRMYRALPFLYELRCVLDWSCTTTSLAMYDWLKLEDMHSSLFLVKCDAVLNRAKHKQGQKQSKLTKFCNGICLFLVLICVIWTPMLMYSSGNPTNIANPIRDASVKIDLKTISGRLTLFETTLCKRISWDELDEHANLDPHGYLTASNSKDIQLICCQADASILWLVPPVVQDRYIKSVSFGMDIIFYWQLTRDRPKGQEVVNYELRVDDNDLPKRSEVINVLNGTHNSFSIRNIYPRYFRVTGSGEVRPLEQSLALVSGNLFLNRGNPEWWSFLDGNVSSGCGNFVGPMAFIVSEETPQGILGDTLSKFSIWGLYITFVLAVGRFIRLQCSDLRMRIPFENLPTCDRLLAICEDIYSARAKGELEVEEVLYWILVKIYRSPHMLLEYTKPD